MLKGKRTLLIFIIMSNIALLAGILYGVSTNTYNPSVYDSGGNPASCGGSAQHSFSAGSHGFIYSYGTTVYHSGQYVGNQYGSGSGTGPAFWSNTSRVSGTASYVSTGHNTTGNHGSYIENTSNPNDWSHDTESSSTYRASD